MPLCWMDRFISISYTEEIVYFNVCLIKKKNEHAFTDLNLRSSCELIDGFSGRQKKERRTLARH